MKKRLTLFLVAVLAIGPLLGLWPLKAQAYTFSGTGDGTSGNPYIIKTAEDLDHVRDNLSASYKLQADIDLSAYGNWQPIGTYYNRFSGNFDGADYTISGMKINLNDDDVDDSIVDVYLGLFGVISQPATITNVRVENVDIRTGYAHVQVGGLVGAVGASTNYKALDRISVTGEIYGNGSTAGGVVGQLSIAELSNSDAHVRIDGGYAYAGGAVGSNSNGIIEQSYATGDITGKLYIGGLVGYHQGAGQLNTYATGDVTGADNTSNVSIGGLTGKMYAGKSIVNSYAAGFVRKGSGSQTGSKAGGLIGSLDGFGNATVTKSYWNSDEDNSGLQTKGWESGTDGAMSREDMKQIDIAGVGWDPAIWGIQTGASYPYLKSFSPVLRVDPLPIAAIYATEPGYNQLTFSGYVRDGSIGEPWEVSYTIKDASNHTVTQDVYAGIATAHNQTFSFSEILDANSYPLGTYSISITAKDTVVRPEQPQTLTFDVVDKKAPPATVLASPSNGQLTNDATPTVSGTAEAGATVTIVLDGSAAGTVTAGEDGSWSWTVGSTLAEGTHTLKARATDGAGNVSADSALLTFTVDRTPPLITLNGSAMMQVEAGSSFTDPGATAADRVEGDITSRISVTGSVYPNQLGTYNLEYRVSNQMGIPAPTVIRSVYVVDTRPPVITILGDDSILLTTGDVYVDPGATAVDSFEGNVPVTVTGSVYNQSPGNYELRYNSQDSSGNAAVEATRTVRVEARKYFSYSSSGSSYASGNADLKRLKVLAGGNELTLIPAFAADTTSYMVETTAEQVDIQIISSDANAVVTLREVVHTGAETIALAEGDNTFEITIKAENGTIKTYSLTVHREIEKVMQPVPGESLACAFSDIRGHWAELQICEATEKGIVEGDSATLFRPQGLVTRVEFAAMLLRTIGTSTGWGEDKLSFTDKDTIPVWARYTVRDAVEFGLLEGYPDGTLRPNQTVSRAEMAVMMARSMKWDIERTQTTAFADDAAIPDWAKGYIQAAFQRELVEGREGNRYMPYGEATRAESAVVLLRLLRTLQ
ncbi:immunoglobulin-like domain-containing protein [Paenibacillus thalictri]|uniref:DUF5011 domain-containing protein n=1 Tax=Paenibacillus thalictri TaxID=2527873 RepID=A0A4Q9DV76_9BACL|nr:immunoglobulin-like domain-containing protein [Paenibacillus thalictri]TBL79860.1 DUF5011 domain-containing protein [Paenibacillus thalictri]